MYRLTLDDEKYPKNLRNISDPPKLLYLMGELLPSDEKSIAIVGTRKASHYGKEIARRFANKLAHLGITIVSGMARGIDTAAHEGALEANGRTIAVLGTGLNNIYPQENKDLMYRIISSGAAISELKPDEKPAIWTFPRRNRIISGLSFGTIMVEGGYKSGAMITAKQALDQGREVFAVPGNIDSDLSRGPHWLIKQGAKLIENVDDILEELLHVLKIPPLDTTSIISNKQKIDISLLTFEEHLVFKELSYSPLHIDEIANISKLNISQLLVLLSRLEMKSLIRQLPGKLFLRKM